MVGLRSMLALQLLVLFLSTTSFNVGGAQELSVGVTSKHPPPPPAISMPPALAPFHGSPPPPFRQSPPPPFHGSPPPPFRQSPPPPFHGSPPPPFRQSPPPPFRRPPPPPPLLKPLIAVEGLVYCRSCKLPGYDKILNAAPLPGALAKLVCYNKKEKRGVVVKTKTNRRGYFLIQSQKLSGFPSRSCKVVVSSPLKVCSKLVFPGLPLRFERVIKKGKTEIALFTAGFFEFTPLNGTKCKL